MHFAAGNIVRARGERFVVSDATAIAGADGLVWRLLLRPLEDAQNRPEVSVLHPVEAVEPDEIPDPDPARPGRLPRFRLLHDAFRLRLAPPSDTLVGTVGARIRPEPYQYVPALRALELPRPRLLLADDVGLGKTIEAGLIIRELAARRRANRVLIVTPAGIMTQWQKELDSKFGLRFTIFDSSTVHETRLRHEAGANPWSVVPRVIASVDFIKRREGAFRELSATKWDVVIVDEAHHLSAGRNEDDFSDRHRLGRWLAEAGDALLLLTATPHNGYDESLASLLALLEPSLVPPSGELRHERYRRHLVRRLKRHIRGEAGETQFLQREVAPIPVELNASERALHKAVMDHAGELEEIATRLRRDSTDAESIRFVATILRKRAASSLYALSQTLDTRLVNLEEGIEEIEVQRDHLRALRRGETVPDDTLARIERDALRNYLSVVRRLGSQVRRAEDERATVESLRGLVDDCRQYPESKLVALLSHLRDMHVQHPTDKIIIFTEYADTAAAISRELARTAEYAGRAAVLTGELSPAEREQVVLAFGLPEQLILVATDAAGEGLNLQRHCHRILHFELPWNPNRLEQRNGRIDRYGQTETPFVSFLYAQDTYEGEVLSLLTQKIERQIRSLGSVGDVLGRLQVERIEGLLSKTPGDIQAAVQEADREIDDEIRRAGGTALLSVLGDGSLDESELSAARQAADRGASASVNLVDFLCAAVVAAGGTARRNGTVHVATPRSWISSSVRPAYERLIPPGETLAGEVTDEERLDEDHPLFVSAVRWVRGSRFARKDDHRLAYACLPDLLRPDVVATFMVQIRDGEGWETERLMAVCVDCDGNVSRSAATDLEALSAHSSVNVAPERLVQVFGGWWQQVSARAAEEARRRAAEWRRAILVQRNSNQARLKDELDRWALAMRDAILGRHRTDYLQRDLFGQSTLPPAVKRRLRYHEERVRRLQEHLERRVCLDDPLVEPLGILLRLPEDIATPAADTSAGGR